MRKLIDLTGKRFGRLIVVRRAENNAQNKPTWLCQCDCGQFSSPSGWHLHSGNTQSCGCRLGGHRHGFASRDKTHPLYTTWTSMRSRCTNPKQREFKNYGGRGVKVCERWDDFAVFLADILAEIGERPPGKTIDRYPDNDGNYEPGNVRWATKKEQANNARKTWNSNLNKISRRRGVTRNKNRWMANITSRGMRHYLGTFNTIEEAAAAYQTAARELHGKFYREA